jgi:hypothetical protein
MEAALITDGINTMLNSTDNFLFKSDVTCIGIEVVVDHFFVYVVWL